MNKDRYKPASLGRNVSFFSRATPHFLLNRPKCILNFSFLQFGINILNVFDSRKVITALSILRRFKCLDKQGFKCCDKAGKRGVKGSFSETALLGYVKQAKP